MLPDTEPLPPGLSAALHESSARRGHIGEPVWYVAETGSTNDLAARLAERGAPDGSMVVAGAQTAGRGRMGRAWHSPAGAGIYASVVFRDRRVAPLLTLAGGVAVAEGIRRATGLPVEIKWPNDVIVRDARRRRKIAGILAEATSGVDGLHHVILGLGINVRTAAYPAALSEVATSIEAELGRAVDGSTVLAETLSELRVQSERLVADPSSVLDKWRALSPTASGSTVEWTDGRSRRRGVTAGIDPAGALLVRVGSATERILAGEVQWL